MDLLETIKMERDIEAVYNLYCDSIDAKAFERLDEVY
jgi:hypothetical protein